MRIFVFGKDAPARRSFDFLIPTPGNVRKPVGTISKSSTGLCSIEIGGNTEVLNNVILKHMANWIHSYSPTSVDIDAILARRRFHQLLTISTERPRNLKPYVDFKNKRDIKQFLTRKCNGKYGNVFATLLSSTSISISTFGIVMPNIPPSLSQTDDYQENSTTGIAIKGSIICPNVFTEISKTLPWLKPSDWNPSAT